VANGWSILRPNKSHRFFVYYAQHRNSTAVPTRTQKRLLIALTAVIAVPVVTLIVSALFLLRHYIASQDIDASGAALIFETERARFAGQQPLVEYQGFDTTVHRDPSRPRHELHTLHMVAYDASDESLTRADMPWWVVRLTTLGGNSSVLGAMSFGDRAARVTVEDIERHGPGLVLDTTGSAFGALAVSDAVFGNKAAGSLMLMWTE
jgi:hypothetical protein